MEHFSVKSGQLKGTALTISYSTTSENLLKGNKLICQNGMANIDPTGQTDQSGPEYSGRTEQKRIFPLDFPLKLPEFLS